MKAVELIYDNDCPNIELARTHLLQAFSKAELPAEWVEWDRGDSSSPAHVHSYGSPTILVNGKDVAGANPSENISCCRLYTGVNSRFEGAPSVELIAKALCNHRKNVPSKVSNPKLTGWWTSLAVLPGIGGSLLPVGLCPACWPAYAGLLSSLGFGFLFETVYLLPVTALLLLTAVATLAYKAGSRRGYKPFISGLTASAIMLVSKFIFESDTAMYGGTAMLIAASLWNVWPRKNANSSKDTCSACAFRTTGIIINTNEGTDKLTK